jgi:hypothetical protein
MEALASIPTKRRSKLPRGMCHPIRPTEITAALSDVPDFKLLSLHFGDRGAYWIDEWRQALREKREIALVGVYPPFRSPDWSIGIKAVPIEHRDCAYTGWTETVLPRLRSWLCDENRATFHGYLNLRNGAVRVTASSRTPAIHG